MKRFQSIKFWIFDLDNTLYSGKTKVFEQVEKKMSKYVSNKLNVNIDEAKKIESIVITNNEKSLNIMELTGLIKKSSYVIANDTGPAHMAAHLGKTGLVIFGYHTTPEKVSIETEKFKAFTVKDLKDLTAESVYLEIKRKLDLIN